jgi:hypothetical protein
MYCCVPRRTGFVIINEDAEMWFKTTTSYLKASSFSQNAKLKRAPAVLISSQQTQYIN